MMEKASIIRSREALFLFESIEFTYEKEVMDDARRSTSFFMKNQAPPLNTRIMFNDWKLSFSAIRFKINC